MKLFRSLLSVLVVPALVLCGCTPTNPGNNQDPNVNNKPPVTRKEPVNQKPPQQRVDPPTTPAKPRVEPPPAVRDHWTNTKPSGSSSGVLNPSFGRKSRRISVLQLKDTIPRLFNGITWKYGNTNMFDSLARTLGQADYMQVTFSTRDSTSLFMKFMDDMAGNVCKAAVKKDLQTQNMETRSVIRYKDVDQNLRFMRLKFHSIYVPENSTESIKRLRTLYDRILAKTRKESTAWEGICIAVLTSPEFFAY